MLKGLGDKFSNFKCEITNTGMAVIAVESAVQYSFGTVHLLWGWVGRDWWDLIDRPCNI